MQKTRESNGIWALYLGTLLLVVIIAAVVWSEYKMYRLGIWIVLGTSGFVFWFIGFASTKHYGPTSPLGDSKSGALASLVCANSISMGTSSSRSSRKHPVVGNNFDYCQHLQ